jgi:hypothetical protein
MDWGLLVLFIQPASRFRVDIALHPLTGLTCRFVVKTVFAEVLVSVLFIASLGLADLPLQSFLQDYE